MIYEPSNGLFSLVERLIRPYQNRRLIKFKLTRPVISFTFDDFPKTAITNGAACLERYDMRGTFYTCAGLEGAHNHHGEHYSEADLAKLDAKGHEIAGHTYDHIDCSTLPHDAIISQLENNKAALRRMEIATPITGFAYPYGATKSRIKPLLGEHFHAIRGIQGGIHYDKADLNELKSYGFYSQTFEHVMQDLRSLKTRPGFATLFTHDISENPTNWGCTPAQFEAAVKLAKDLNAIVLPVRDAIAYLESTYV